MLGVDSDADDVVTASEVPFWILCEELEFFVRNVPHEEFKFLTQIQKECGCSLQDQTCRCSCVAAVIRFLSPSPSIANRGCRQSQQATWPSTWMTLTPVTTWILEVGRLHSANFVSFSQTYLLFRLSLPAMTCR